MDLTRRDFLKATAATGATFLVAEKGLALQLLQPVVDVDNPLAIYPERGWE